MARLCVGSPKLAILLQAGIRPLRCIRIDSPTARMRCSCIGIVHVHRRIPRQVDEPHGRRNGVCRQRRAGGMSGVRRGRGRGRPERNLLLGTHNCHSSRQGGVISRGLGGRALDDTTLCSATLACTLQGRTCRGAGSRRLGRWRRLFGFEALDGRRRKRRHARGERCHRRVVLRRSVQHRATRRHHARGQEAGSQADAADAARRRELRARALLLLPLHAPALVMVEVAELAVVAIGAAPLRVEATSFAVVLPVAGGAHRGQAIGAQGRDRELILAAVIILGVLQRLGG
mmetsp:Transcript_99117/g.285021  ORF Transcript_99117/g.285021 Transcript_99117/m.285021 type:complete len:288 (-) Transcript_99117:50-913(-)